MRNFYSLTYSSTEENLLTVTQADLHGFDYKMFWTGMAVEQFPAELRLLGSGNPTDSVRNKLSWQILSQKAAELITSVAKRDLQVLPAPLFDANTGAAIDGYEVLVPTRRIRCLDRERSAFEVDDQFPEQLVIYRVIIDSSLVPATVHAFCLDENPYGELYLSQTVVDQLIGKGLRGMSLVRN